MQTPCRQRWLRGGLVSLLGLLALALPAADLSPRVPDPWGPETFAGDIAVASLAALLVAAGLWLAASDWEPRYLHTVVVRTYAATAVAAVLAGWATVLWITDDPTQYVVAIDGVLITALLTFVISVVSTQNARVLRADRRSETASRELAEEVLDHSSDAAVVVDADGRVAWANETAVDVFGLDGPQRGAAGTESDVPVGTDYDDAIGDALEPIESTTRASGAADGVEYHVDADGRSPGRFVCRRHQIEDGPHAGGRIEQFVDVTERRNAVDALETATGLADSAFQKSDATTPDVLDAGRDLLDTEYAAFTHVDGDRTVEIVRSDRVDADDGVPELHEQSIDEVRKSKAVRTGYRTADAPDAVGGFEFDHGATASFRAFLAAPVEADGELVGVVTFLARDDEPFADWERAVAKLFADWTGAERFGGGRFGDGRDGSERYERALDHERERLEFVNRVIRHNILNGLNLLNARAQQLERVAGDDPAAADHLDVIRDRIQEMADLTDTIRTFTDAVVADAPHDVEPVPVRDRLLEEVQDAHERYDAAFRVHDLPDSALTVAADELLPEVFDNVLSNAVEHNDAENPVVVVWTSEGGDSSATGDAEGPRTLTVHVADNGPGIPDETRQAMLSHAEANLDDPAHGFGFYLVREMVESYDGEVRIRENEVGGTTVDLELPVHEGAER